MGLVGGFFGPHPTRSAVFLFSRGVDRHIGQCEVVFQRGHLGAQSAGRDPVGIAGGGDGSVQGKAVSYRAVFVGVPGDAAGALVIYHGDGTGGVAVLDDALDALTGNADQSAGVFTGVYGDIRGGIAVGEGAV